MKKTTWCIIAGVVVLGALAWYGATHLIASRSPGWYGIRMNPGPLEVATSTYKEEAPSSTIDIAYPRVQGLSNTSAEEDLNAKLEAAALDPVSQFRKDVSDAVPIPELAGAKSGLYVGYETSLLHESLASFAFIDSAYIVGMAHPNNYILTLNYDVKNKKELSLGDLFKRGSDYLGPISRYALSDLKKQFAENGIDASAIFEEGAAPKQENYQMFLLTNDALVIVFNPYQVAAYAVGAPRVSIPWSELKDIVDPHGPAGKLVFSA